MALGDNCIRSLRHEQTTWLLLLQSVRLLDIVASDQLGPASEQGTPAEHERGADVKVP